MGKGRGDSTAQVVVSFPRLLPASQSLREHRDVLNLAKIAGFSPTELQGAVFQGVFPQKARWNHPTLPTSAKKGWAGKRQCYSHPLPDESREILAR